MNDDEDPLGAFENLAACPSCAALAPKGTPRCPECGAFHMPIQDAEERIPDDGQRAVEPLPGFFASIPELFLLLLIDFQGCMCFAVFMNNIKMHVYVSEK